MKQRERERVTDRELVKMKVNDKVTERVNIQLVC